MSADPFDTAPAAKYGSRTEVPRHRGNGNPLILLPKFAPDPKLARILTKHGDDRTAAEKRAIKGKYAYYSRASSFGKAIESTKALEEWGKRMVAIGLARRPDLVLNVAAHSDDPDANKRIIGDICEQAIEAAKASAAATTGTALHKLAELADAGTPLPPINETAARDLDAYRLCMESYGVTHLRSEQFVVCDALQVAGSFDRFMQTRIVPGTTYVGDIKTGNVEKDTNGQVKRDANGRPVLGYVNSVAVQLAVYANSELYDPTTGERTPLDVHKGAAIVIHLPQGLASCELHWLDIGAGWEAATAAAWAKTWGARKDLTVPFTAVAS